jgi:hypothetical protein
MREAFPIGALAKLQRVLSEDGLLRAFAPATTPPLSRLS